MFIIYHKDGDVISYWDGTTGWYSDRTMAYQFGGESTTEREIARLRKMYPYEFHIAYTRVS